MNFDAVAPFYRFLEYTAFGRTLERRRFQFLNDLTGTRRVLIAGDGDGRFTAQFVASNPHALVDYVELSSKMIALAKRRLASNCRVRFIQADVRNYLFQPSTYDLIVTHFLLDCLSPSDVTALIGKLASAASPAAYWLISEFQQPEHGWRAVHASLWLKSMYWFFRVASSLEVSHLPSYRDKLAKFGFSLQYQVDERAGLVASELWQSATR